MCRTGRWRTCWIVDKAAGQVNGTIHVDVHYFEQGNVSSQMRFDDRKLTVQVQLATKHTSSFPYPEASGSQSTASQIVTTISKIETSYQLELNDVYGDLGEKAFRS
jgi:capping protein alpha